MSDSDSTYGESVDGGKGRIFPCLTCGADMVFEKGTQNLICNHCGGKRDIVLQPNARVQEQDFDAMMQKLIEEKQKKAETEAPAEHQEVQCEACGATVAFIGTLTSSSCPYCGTPIQRARIHKGGNRIPVDALSPFVVREDKARQIFQNWVSTRWFAPNKFKHAGDDGKFQGSYLPFWTFDSMTYTRYTGQRGEHYYVTVGSGKNESRQRRTRWYSTSGHVRHFFDDRLVFAAKGMPTSLINNLGPWKLNKAVPFTPEYLAGITARTYDVELKEGYQLAKRQMETEIRSLCEGDIGGDDQRLDTVDTQFADVTFKHILLPIWILAYQFHNKPYVVAINAVTGKLDGQRPYSMIKIGLATLLGLIAFIVAGTVLQQR
ncbi:hypothetical protein SH668x_001636 [Planctomicrobium sp. SH668]|uniref:hypothetical protein n=1 Tax=Planctomicrobium sp. SH668 TaxID=3448126 RepID=UPI003F5C2D5E